MQTTNRPDSRMLQHAVARVLCNKNRYVYISGSGCFYDLNPQNFCDQEFITNIEAWFFWKPKRGERCDASVAMERARDIIEKQKLLTKAFEALRLMAMKERKEVA